MSMKSVKMSRAENVKGTVNFLLHHGYRYRRDRVHSSSSTWRCYKRDCRGRLIVHKSSKKPTTPHNHAPNPADNESFLIKQQIKDAARSSVETPRNIIQGCTAGASSETAVILPSYDALRKSLQRERARSSMRLKPYNHASDIIFEEIRTEKGDNFIIWDYTDADRNRIVMFGTKQNISLLSEFKHWCIDGTFKTAPLVFMQLLTLHAFVDDRAIPLVYTLLCNKQEETYRTVLCKIKEMQLNIRPQSVLCDFEIGLFKAVKNTFPETKVIGCFFHLGQILWRKIQELRLTEVYRASEVTRLQCKMIIALAFVPIRDVQFSFEIIAEDFAEELQPLLIYWEKNYIGRRLLNIPPRFPIENWNLFDRTLQNLPRTNNSVEAWHNSFKTSVACHHPAVNKLIDHLKKEQGRTEIYMSKYRCGFRKNVSKSAKTYQLNERLKTLMHSYRFSNIKEYVAQVAANLSI